MDYSYGVAPGFNEVLLPTVIPLISRTKVKIMQNKLCKKCGEVKSISFFFTEKRNKDKLYSYCKDCCNQSVKDYQRTKLGVITQIHAGQKNTSEFLTLKK